MNMNGRNASLEGDKTRAVRRGGKRTDGPFIGTKCALEGRKRCANGTNNGTLLLFEDWACEGSGAEAQSKNDAVDELHFV